MELMNALCHIWVSVYVVLNYTWYKKFKWNHLKLFHWNIDTTNQTRNHKNLIRMYILNFIKHLTSGANLFTYFYLDTHYSFFIWKQFKLVCNVISSKINDGFIFLQKSTGTIESVRWRITALLWSINLSLYRRVR